jgi:hypothetical protein
LAGRIAAAAAVGGAVVVGLCAAQQAPADAPKPPAQRQQQQAKPAPPGAKSAKGDHKSHAKTPAAVGVAGMDVYVDDSRVHLLLATRAAAKDKPRLSYVGSTDGGATWSEPVAVGEGQPTPDPVKRGADAQIAAAGDRLVAVWTTGAETRFGRGPLASAVSSDGGRTWRPGPNPADDGLETDHAYVDLAADDAGAFHAVWLDGRGGEDAGKGLRYARSADGGATWSANATLDEQCCECCWNAIQTLPGGRVNVLYRNRDPRDMSLIASADGGRTWAEPVPVGAFDWAFDGCPHVGGALAGGAGGAGRAGSVDRTLFGVVWTAKGGADTGVFAVASPDGGTTWNPPVPLGGPQSNRPDVASPGGPRAAAVWDAYLDTGGNAVFSATTTDGGATWSDPVRLSDDTAVATHPRVIATKDGFRTFWTEQRPGKPVAWVSRALEN